MEKFKTPKLLITDYYDEQIRQVDIYIEELLEKYKENDLLPKEETNRCNISDDDSDDEYSYSDSNDDTINKIDGFKDPYQSKYNYDPNNLLNLDIIPGTTRIRDYLKLFRSKAIDELKNVEQYSLDNYELNKDLYKYDRKSLTDEKLEEMRQNLFKDKFAFVVKIEESNKSLLKLNTILTDFYLDEKDIGFLKRHFQPLKQQNDQKKSDKSLRDILDEKSFIVYLVREYIIGFTHNYEYGTEIISITKSSLFEVNRTNIVYMLIDAVNLPLTSSIDFSFIKSLRLDPISSLTKNESQYEMRDLSGLKHLEYLQLKDMTLNSNSFNGLYKLIKLELIHCFSPGDNKISFDSLKSLQILRIKYLYFPIELKSLENLNVLIIEYMEKLEYIINVSESITYLDLNTLYIENNNPDKVFSRLFLPNLLYLRINYNEFPCFKEQWFRGMKYLKELILFANCLENLDFCRFNKFTHLEKLDISTNQIEKLDEGVFSKLKRLKWLDLSKNPILELGSNRFLGLKNLETLFLNDINEKKKFNRLEKDAFNGLTNLKNLSLEKNHFKYIDSEAFSHTPKLKELSLKYNRLESIDPKLFSYTPNLVELKICGNKMKLEENIFSNLKHLKKIELRESDVEHINKNILEDLKKSNIEFIIK